MTRRSTTPDDTVQFAGLTTHNNVKLSDKAAEAVSADHSTDRQIYPDDMPETSLATALRDLERAESTGNAWQVPENVASNIDVAAINDDTPDGISLHETHDGRVFVSTDRRQSVVSPDKLTKWVQGDYRRDDNNQFFDPLWHVPSNDYTVVPPLDFYEPLEQSLRDEDLGDAVFGEIRKYKGGGEVHMELLFDCFKIDNPDAMGREQNDGDVAADGGVGGHILLGIRTGYDFFGGTAMYAEGFAQDTWCSNSIRSITDEKTRRHVGDTSEVRDWWDDILAEMELMTDRLAGLIEQANQIELDYLSMEFSEVMGHNDDLMAFYESAGFPTYLAREASSHARSRADNQFLPTMWEVHSGATYAITHHYRGGENTSRLNELVQVGNDMLMNPAQAVTVAESNAEERAERKRRAAAGEDGEGGEGELDELAFSTSVEKFRQSISDQKDEFESKQDELQSMLVGVGGEAEAEN